ncbi:MULTISPECIES: fimbrial protein [unclassified Providencia]|uniref:fimbrial protein n=1 Tax=unclassified Providencia TaxID=2633465 RepID=UPI0023497C02|nr:fimbrial protein [Providencia sp. PROV164]
MSALVKNNYGYILLLFSLMGGAIANTPGTHEFTFNVTVPKNTCEIAIKGTSNNVVDFGNIPLHKFKKDASDGKLKLPFTVTLSKCKTKNFENNYLTLEGNYTQNDGFLDDPGKTFAVRISKKDNANPADQDFITNTNKVIWNNIVEDQLSKDFYAYVMCKNNTINCAVDDNIGKFKATLTLTYIAD